jgi:signal peptidase II
LKSFFNKQISLSAAHFLFWPVAVSGIIADLWSKSAVFEWLNSLPLQHYSVIDGFFQFVLVENRGAAWGIAAGRTLPLIIISAAAMVVVVGIFLFNRKPQLLSVLAMAFFEAGICGNLYDRIFNAGRVRDFLDFYYGDWHFPAFNIADSMLTVAVGILILATIFGAKHESPSTPDPM